MSDLTRAARLAARELRGGLSGFRILIACLALGVAAIAAVGSVRQAIESGLAEQGAEMLGGDAEVSLTYRFADADERAWLADRATAVSEIADFRSMATTPGADGTRALSQVKAVDDAYPLVGEVALDPAMPLAEALAGDGDRPGVVMAPALISRLDITPGNAVEIGGVAFTLMAALTEEPDANASGFTLGPRSLVARSALEGSALLAPGTLFDSRLRLVLPNDTDLDAMQAAVAERFATSGARWRDARNGAPGISSFVERLSAFLVLVGLAGLAVGGVGVSAAVRAYLAGKIRIIATLKTLGATRRVIFLTYFLQIGALAALGILLGLILGGALPLLLAPTLGEMLPIPADFGLYPGPLAEAALYGALTALIFTLWPLARLDEVRAAQLFRDPSGGRGWPRPRFLVLLAVLLAALVASAAWLSGAVELTLWTFAGIAVALVLLAAAAAALQRAARTLARAARGRPALRWAAAAIAGPGTEALPVVLSLGLGLSVLASVGQIDGNLRAAIAEELPTRAPSFFAVDIQPGQLDPFLDRVTTDPAVSRVDRAPMLRGVITQINGQPAAQVAGEHWVLNGDRGVSYADALPENTTVTAGESWGEGYDGPPQVSVSAEEAEEMGLSLGDRLTVNVLGRDIEAEITSFRAVDFSTAGMGFILVMNQAALAGAPHSWIATIYAEPQAEAAILRDLGRDFPNVTAISVRDAIALVTDLMGSIAAATSWGAGATLVTGFLVLIGAALSGERARRYEAALLKTLGASRARILGSFALRAALLGAGAGLVALLTGILGAWAISHFVLETSFRVIWPNALAVVLGGLALNLAAGLLFAWRPLSARPAQVLRARD
ncbi:FtsX-like permease family protein [Pseudooceanicola marinus]|uniref:FtsX-like permease family protein n=1 Tax=Pseudooceanicola marinus TaxID=396013 RepID=A0A1X6ZZT4_9RHOB|nr:FtsX-like permease family protein [Pseudooceanicola marinus]PJE30177.1 drug:proton antiporter [Pseudooceanicola marinus]SLN66413.1 FtsX-like permease family protein [Pseudooceanicola marinus]